MTPPPSNDSTARLDTAGGSGHHIRSTPAGYLSGRAHEAAMQGLTRGIRDGAGLLVLTGEAGSGKSTLLRRFVEETAGVVDSVLCRGGGLDFGQVVYFLCAELGLSHTSPTLSSEMDAIRHHLSVTARRPVALLLDDADRLEGNALEQLLRLCHTVEGRKQRLHLVLSGQRGLQPRLKRERESYPLVKKGIFVRIGRLSVVEASAFVERAAARRAGATPFVIEAAAMQAIVDLGKGNPGRLETLCAIAVAQVQAAGGQAITLAMVESVASGSPSAGAASLAPQPVSAAPLPSVAQPTSGGLSGDPQITMRPRANAVLPAAGRNRLLVAVLGVVLAVVAVNLLPTRGLRQADDQPPPTAPDGAPARALAPRPAALAAADSGGPVPERRDLDVVGITEGALAAAPSPQPLARPGNPVASASVPVQTPGEGAVGDPGAGLPPSSAPALGAELPPAEPLLRRVTRLPPESAEPPAPAIARAPTRGEQVRAHLARAEAAMARNALSTPADDNAVKWAESALSVDPGNQAATGMLRTIIDQYLAWSNAKLRRGALPDATRFAGRARALSEHATRDQLAAVEVLENQIAARERELARASRRRYQMEGPQWLKDLDSWVSGLPLPR